MDSTLPLSANTIHTHSSQAPQEAKAGREVQQAIYHSNLDILREQVGKYPTLLQKPLPNGQLPLHFAVQQRNIEAVKCLLSLGADAALKDDQQLNAVEYATLMKNEPLLAEIFHHYIAADLSVIKNFLETGASKSSIKTAVKQINAIKREYYSVKFANGIGYFPWRLVLIRNDSKQVLSKDSELMDKHRALAEDKSLADNGLGDTILHLAALSGSTEFVSDCLSHYCTKENINCKNKQGWTPLHYAAASGRLDIMKLFIEQGADLRIEDEHKLTPLMLIGGDCDERDPLKVTIRDLLIFSSVATFWAVQFIPTERLDWRLQTAIQLLSTTAFLASDIVMDVSLFKSWYEFLLCIYIKVQVTRLAGMGFPHIDLIIKALSAYHIYLYCQNVFQGLNACWRNAFLGSGKALFKAVISEGPKLQQMYRLSEESLLGRYRLDQSISKSWNLIANAILPCSKTASFSACMENWFSAQNPCRVVFQFLTGATEATLQEVKKAYRNLAKQTHPDKGGSSEAFQKVQVAYETALGCLGR